MRKDTTIKNIRQSKKIRSILFRLWEQDREGFNIFEEYYINKTEKYIGFLMTKFNPTMPED